MSTAREARAATREVLDRLVEGGGNPDLDEVGRVGDALFAVVRLLHREHRLRRALADPATDAEARARLLQELLGEQLPASALQILQLLVRARWSSAGELLAAVDSFGSRAWLARAEADGALDDVEDEVFRFGRLLEREHALYATLSSRGVPDERKTALLRGLLADRARTATLRLLEHVVTTPSGRSVEESIGDLVRLAAERRERLLAEVRSAIPLSFTQEERLRSALARLYRREIQLQVAVDPSVVGGLSVRVGDELIDSTVASRLETVGRPFAG